MNENIIMRPVNLSQVINSIHFGSKAYNDPVDLYSSFDIQNAILKFIELENDWDGMGACAPAKSAIYNAFYFIELLPKSVIALIEQDDIICTTYGTIVIDIESQDKILSVEIGDQGLGYFFEASDEVFLKKENQIFNRYYLSDDLVKIIQILQE